MAGLLSYVGYSPRNWLATAGVDAGTFLTTGTHVWV